MEMDGEDLLVKYNRDDACSQLPGQHW